MPQCRYRLSEPPPHPSILECCLAWACVGNHSYCEFQSTQPSHVQKIPFDPGPPRTPGLTILPTPSSKMTSEPFGKEVGYRCPACGWTLHRHLFYALWPAGSFCVWETEAGESLVWGKSELQSQTLSKRRVINPKSDMPEKVQSDKKKKEKETTMECSKLSKLRHLTNPLSSV